VKASTARKRAVASIARAVRLRRPVPMRLIHEAGSVPPLLEKKMVDWFLDWPTDYIIPPEMVK